MTYEMEIKFRVDDVAAFRAHILTRGAERMSDTDESDSYYSHPSRNFVESGEAFRIRNFGDRACITYKGKKLGGEVKTREEIELDISSAGDFARILDRLGFSEAGSVVKRRENYELDGFHICIDSVDGVGVFAEIEKVGTDLEKTQQEILALSRELGVSEIEKRSYLAMVLGKLNEA